MAIELKIPSAGESITEVTIAEWVKEEGSFAKLDETVAVIETDKANVDLAAPVGGKITKILKAAGEIAEVGEVIGYMEAAEGAAQASAPAAAPTPAPAPAAAPTPAPAPKAVPESKPAPATATATGEPPAASPAVRRAIRERGVDPAKIKPNGGRITMDDLVARQSVQAPPSPGLREEERVKMTRLRKRIAERLVGAQHESALLTTFNEIDMSAVMALRKTYKEQFIAKHEIKLGFMSFFVKAAIEALKTFPAINAYIDGDEVVYHDYYDIGVAVGGGRGLVVPIIRNAERMSFAQVEKTIADFGRRARDNKLQIEELEGGTFTISNGGVYGSLMSTPIVNPPQSGILGMHAIQQRPIAKDGQVVIAPMMYIALTYDHRIVDGREAVGFLVKIKELVETPTRLLLEV